MGEGEGEGRPLKFRDPPLPRPRKGAGKGESASPAPAGDGSRFWRRHSFSLFGVAAVEKSNTPGETWPQKSTETAKPRRARTRCWKGKTQNKKVKWENGIEKVGLGSIQDATERVPSVPGMGLN